MTNIYQVLLAAVLSLTIHFAAGGVLADSRTKVPAPPPPPPPPRNVEAPQARSDIGAKLQMQLNEANSLYNRSLSTGAPSAGGFGRVPTTQVR